MNCAMTDRDDYIWYDLSKRVNGTCSQCAKILATPIEAVNNGHNA
jgi:hypothetical protein